jgi:hypothetical protein
MPTKKVTKKVSQINKFVRGDLVWLSGMSGSGAKDNVYRVEDITIRDETTNAIKPYSSLLKLRLILKVFYSWERDDGFHWYDEMNCTRLSVEHVDELKKRFGKIIEDIYALYTENSEEKKSASTDCPSKRTRKRKTMESKSDGPKKNGGRSKKAL